MAPDGIAGPRVATFLNKQNRPTCRSVVVFKPDQIFITDQVTTDQHFRSVFVIKPTVFGFNRPFWSVGFALFFCSVELIGLIRKIIILILKLKTFNLYYTIISQHGYNL